MVCGSRLDLLRSASAREQSVSRARRRQLQHAGGVSRALLPGDPVWARGFRQPDKWLKGTVVGTQGSRRYLVDNGGDRLIHRHIDQIKRRSRMSDVPCPSGGTNENTEGQNGSEDGVGRSEVSGDGDGASEGEEGVFTTPSSDRHFAGECSPNTTQSESGSSQPPSPNSPRTPVNRFNRVRKPVLRYGIDY